ncbi:MAG: glycosyltransferase family 2 protein [Acidobacteriota bacterium]|nr:glycosyltransferase family 2 protein [Acidobacteriota bacterium]
MTRPHVSVVIETINARTAGASGSFADSLARTLEGLDHQTYPQELIERVIVLDREVAAADANEVCRRYPSVKILSSLVSNYFAAKNVGVAAATCDFVALLDSDCVPAPGWLEALMAAFSSGAAAVGGRSTYKDDSLYARTFSVPHFSYALAERGGLASGFNIHNVAFRRELLLSHPFDARIRRDGGCYLLFHQLRAEGARVAHEPRALVWHGMDFRGLGFARKHFNRGRDGVAVYQLDERAVLRGTRVLRRFGAVALVAITGRRIIVDWLRMMRHRRQIGIPLLALPYFCAVAVVTRCIELAGGLAAIVAQRSHG